MSDHQPPIRETPRPISDDPNAKSDQPPPVDPEALADYAEFEAFRKAKAEADATEPEMPEAVELVVDGQVRRYEMTRLDKDVLAHLQVLTTFADNDAEKAVAVFEALLLPDAFDALKTDLRPALQQIRRDQAAAKAKGEEPGPGISDVWVAMARTVTEPLQELIKDPKRAASLAGQSPTGRGSKPGSPVSALPSVT